MESSNSCGRCGSYALFMCEGCCAHVGAIVSQCTCVFLLQNNERRFDRRVDGKVCNTNTFVCNKGSIGVSVDVCCGEK